MENYRREVKVLLQSCEKCGMEISHIAAALDVSASAVYSWKNGVRVMHKKHLQKLKALAEGKLVEPDTTNLHPPNQDIDALKKEYSDLKERVAKLEGFIEGVKSQNFQKAEHKQQ